MADIYLWVVNLGSLLDYKKGALCNSVCIADILCSATYLDAHRADLDAQDSLIQQQVKHVCINKL